MKNKKQMKTKIKEIQSAINGVFMKPEKNIIINRGVSKSAPRIGLYKFGLQWLDKRGTPVYLEKPFTVINLLFFSIYIVYESPLKDLCKERFYWEQVIWFLMYADKDINKARKTYPWVNVKTGVSKWNNKVILDNVW